MTLQLLDDNWLKVLDTTISGVVDRYLLGSFVNPFTIVSIESSTANPLWTSAGELATAIDTEVGKAYGKKQELFLGDLNLINSDALTDGSYELWYFPLDRLGQTTLLVYEYQGQTIDSQITDLVDSLASSNLLKADLTNLGQQIETISQSIERLNNDYQESTQIIAESLVEILSRIKPTEPPAPEPDRELNYLELRTLQLI